MKIAILSGLYPPDGHGGAEKVASLTATELAALGHEVMVVTTAKKNEIAEIGKSRTYKLSPRNIFWYGEIARFPFFIRSLWHAIDIFNFWQAKRVGEILKKEKPDFVWTHNLKGLGFLIPRLIKKLGMRHVHTVHDIQLLVPSGVATALSRLGLYGRLTRRLFGSPSIVTSPSAWLLEVYRQHGFFSQSLSLVLPHVFAKNESVFANQEKKQRLLFLGQLEATKGLPFLIEVARENNLPLTMAGSGSLESYVRKSGLDYRGQLSGEALASVWREIKFLIVPSLILENSPTVILESFAHGVPVVAASIGGIPELVEEGKTGFLFEPGNHTSFMEALERAQRADYVALSRATQEKHEQLYVKYAQAMNTILN